MGLVAYRIAGDPDHQHEVVASWKNPIVGRNTYQASVTVDDLGLEIHGGTGTNAILVLTLLNSKYPYSIPSTQYLLMTQGHAHGPSD